MTDCAEDTCSEVEGENDVENVNNENVNFDCTYCDTVFTGPPQANEKLEIYKNHLVEFHKISKDVNKMLHQMASQYKSDEKQRQQQKNVLSSKDNQIGQTKKLNHTHTQTSPKDFYRHFMHQEWDDIIDWKSFQKPSNPKPKILPNQSKENKSKLEPRNNESLPVIGKALSLKAEAFEMIGLNMQAEILDHPKATLDSSPSNKCVSNTASLEPTNKNRELNINDWTRPIKPRVPSISIASPSNPNTVVKLKWGEKEKMPNEKYTFDLVKEPSEKRQKIVVRYKQIRNDEMLSLAENTKTESSMHNLEQLNVPDIKSETNEIPTIAFEGDKDCTNQTEDSDNRIDSELYTFNDFVSEEEVVSTNVISNCVEKNQEHAAAKNDSLSKLINDTIGSEILSDSRQQYDDKAELVNGEKESWKDNEPQEFILKEDSSTMMDTSCSEIINANREIETKRNHYTNEASLENSSTGLYLKNKKLISNEECNKYPLTPSIPCIDNEKTKRMQAIVIRRVE